MYIKKHKFTKDTCRFRKEWQHGMCVPSGVSSAYEGIRIRANSKCVIVMTPKSIVILTLDHGDLVKKIKFWNRQREGRWSQSSVVASERHLLATRLLQNDEVGHPGRELLR